MNKIIPLSLVAIVSLYAAEIELDVIGVESTVITEVAENAQTSADVAVALSSKVPSIDMNRRSGIANDILIRGQKRDNISVEVDGTKVHGACPNRMDPPTSHILANQIEEVEVTEGPYDVETFGVMSGGVKITTKKPTKEFHGELNAGLGSFGYKKADATLSGGNDFIRVLISASTESSDQYEDGNGDTMIEQVEKRLTPSTAGTAYKAEYKDMEAYTKKSLMAKAFITLSDEQELRLSYTANRSDDILYPNSAMDAVYDDSNIYSIEYDVKNLTDIYKNVNIQYYYSDVDHPMSTKYRLSSNNPAKDNTNHLTTSMQGLKLKNTFDLDNSNLVVGFDGSKRNWDGRYYNTTTGIPLAAAPKSIDDATTKNIAMFATLEKKLGKFNVKVAARYDATKITNQDASMQDKDYDALSGNIFTSYNINKNNKLFLGLGQAYRVPDARELYNVKSNGTVDGTDTLDQTRNREIDLGYELTSDTANFKVKTFYSKLSDYIYYQKGTPTTPNSFKNIDATIYGGEISAEYFVSDELTLDTGISYKRGKKDNALADQEDRDLADIAPLRGNIAVHYEYMNKSIASAEVVASENWKNFDEDNGEVALDSWAILNLKIKHTLNKNFDFTVGVNNLFDRTYIQSNSYYDLILLDNTILMNEPGRYLYTNLSYKF